MTAPLANDKVKSLLDAANSFLENPATANEIAIRRIENDAESLRSSHLSAYFDIKAACRTLLNDKEGAVGYFERSIAAHLDDAETWGNYGVSLIHFGAETEVPALLDRALARFPSDPVLLGFVDSLSSKVGDFKSAAAACTLAEKLKVKHLTDRAPFIHVALSAIESSAVDPKEIPAAVQLVRRVLREKGVPRLRNAWHLNEVDDDCARASLVYELLVDLTPAKAIEVEQAVFDALNAAKGPAESTGLLTFLVSCKN